MLIESAAWRTSVKKMAAHERVIWHRPHRRVVAGDREPSQAATFGARLDARISHSMENRFQTALERQRDVMLDPDIGTGIPVVEGADTAKKQAIGLLKRAAEVEHALMVQYLYAADSIDPDDDDRELAKKLRRIAQEEMGHLGTVQNLLLLLGGPQEFYMQRDLRRTDGQFKFIPFVLEPVTRLSLAKYVVAEMPAQVPEAKQAKVAELADLAAKDLGFEPDRVGALYAMIRWLFLPKAEAVAWMDLKALVPDAPLPNHPHLEESDFQPAAVIEAHELFGRDWGDESRRFLLEKARDRPSALDALKLIMEQGEGFDSNEDAHFDEFLELVEAFDNKPFGRPIATSPTLTPGQGGEEPTAVTAPYTGKWVEVQALQYQLLIVGLLHAMSMPGTGNDASLIAARGELARQSVQAMINVFSGLASLLISLPVGGAGSAAAGPSYDLDPDIAATADATEYVKRQRAILIRLGTLYDEIKAHAEFDPDATVDLFGDLHKQDRERQKFLDKLSPPPSV